MPNGRLSLSDIQSELVQRRPPSWAGLASCSQPTLEPTCYALLALGSKPTTVLEIAQHFLLRAQNPNGSESVLHSTLLLRSTATILSRLGPADTSAWVQFRKSMDHLLEQPRQAKCNLS